MPRLPPLNALRAFETLARHGTLTRAADELLVTPTAVGRHIKNLEDILGVALVKRDSGPLLLTPRGRAYARSLHRAFELMTEATRLLAESSERVQVRLQAYMMFLVKWLIPRLSDFHRLHPGVELHLTTASDPVNFDYDDVDLGIRYGDGKWPGLDVTPLFNDAMVVVGNAAAQARFAAMPIAAALAGETLLVHTLRLDDWPDWLESAGLAELEISRRIAFDDLALIYQGALDGLGVALCQTRYLVQDLAEGRLHRLSPVVLHRQRGFYLVCRAENAFAPGVRAFKAWIGTQSDFLGAPGLRWRHRRPSAAGCKQT